jgi:hypothetical protein
LQHSSLVDRVFRLPSRQLVMTSARALAGVIATCATTGMLSGWIYWIYLRVLVLDQPEFDDYALGISNAHPFLFYLPAALGITANVLTLTDLFRHRRVRIGKAILVIVIVWLLGALSTWLYWFGEFRKNRTGAAMENDNRQHAASESAPISS